MELTWLDLLAANFAGFGLIALLIFAVREARRAKSVFGWAMVAALIVFGSSVVIYRAGYWYEVADKGPAVIVPSVAAQ
jgi:hypothetical protein